MIIIKKNDQRNEIIAILFILALSVISLVYSYKYASGNSFKLTLASIGIIFYLVLIDYKYKKRKAKEDEEARSSGHRVISLSKSADQRLDIGNIAKQSRKDKKLSVNQSSEAGSEEKK